MISSRSWRMGLLSLVTAGLVIGLAGPGFAKKPRSGGYRYVRVTSSYDPWKTITAPVRHGPGGGEQVKLPGGSWIDCFGGCASALRRQYLDYWETLREDAPSP